MNFNYNDILGTLGALTALGSHVKASNDTVYKPNTYAEDPVEQLVLNDLDGYNISPYPAISAMYNADRSARYANNRSGGLSAALKYIGNIALSLGLQLNIGNLLYAHAQNRFDNKLKANQLKSTIASNRAQRRQQANQHDVALWLRGQNAKNSAIQGSKSDMLAQLQQWAANKMKLDQFNDMYYLYSTDPKRFIR